MSRERTLETCLVIATGLLVVWIFYRIDLLIFIAIAVGVLGAFFKRGAAGLAWLWFRLGESMGFVVSKIVLSLVFFVFLLPMALLYRLFQGNPMQLKKRAEAGATYWTDRKHQYAAKDFDTIW